MEDLVESVQRNQEDPPWLRIQVIHNIDDNAIAIVPGELGQQGFHPEVPYNYRGGEGSTPPRRLEESLEHHRQQHQQVKHDIGLGLPRTPIL